MACDCRLWNLHVHCVDFLSTQLHCKHTQACKTDGSSLGPISSHSGGCVSYNSCNQFFFIAAFLFPIVNGMVFGKQVNIEFSFIEVATKSLFFGTRSTVFHIFRAQDRRVNSSNSSSLQPSTATLSVGRSNLIQLRVSVPQEIWEKHLMSSANRKWTLPKR